MDSSKIDEYFRNRLMLTSLYPSTPVKQHASQITNCFTMIHDVFASMTAPETISIMLNSQAYYMPSFNHDLYFSGYVN